MNRAFVVIDGLRPGGSQDPSLADAGFFRHTVRSGRVNISRAGSTFEARTRDVGSFTLLLLPDVIDFSKPVTATVNGNRVFQDTVKKIQPSFCAGACGRSGLKAQVEAQVDLSRPGHVGGPSKER